MKVAHQGLIWVVRAQAHSVTNGQLEYLLCSNKKIKVALASRCKIIAD